MARFPDEIALQQAGRSGKATRVTREDRYDFRAALFYSPVVYQRDEMPRARVQLPDDWSASLAAFVRDEFNRRSTVLDTTVPRVPDDALPVEQIDFIDTAREIVHAYEYRYVYDNPRLQALVESLRGTWPAERLTALLCTDDFGQRLNGAHLDHGAVEKALRQRLDERAGLHAVMPCLPFRDQNPFRTPNRPSTITLAEVLFLARVHAWKLAIYRVLPGGGHMVCACDGTLYAETLGISVDDAQKYLQDLRLIRDKLNLSRSVSLVDLREIAEAVATARGVDFWHAVDQCFDQLRDRISPRDAIVSLLAGMRWNVSPRMLGDDRATVWAMLAKDPEDLLVEAEADAGSAAGELLDASVRYAAINLVLRLLDPLRHAFPDFMRFTMHPKPNQIAFPRLGSVFPWNGVAVLSDLEARTHKARIDPLLRVTATQAQPMRVLVDPRWWDEPLGFITGQQ